MLMSSWSFSTVCHFSVAVGRFYTSLPPSQIVYPLTKIPRPTSPELQVQFYYLNITKVSSPHKISFWLLKPHF